MIKEGSAGKSDFHEDIEFATSFREELRNYGAHHQSLGPGFQRFLNLLLQAKERLEATSHGAPEACVLEFVAIVDAMANCHRALVSAAVHAIGELCGKSFPKLVKALADDKLRGLNQSFENVSEDSSDACVANIERYLKFLDAPGLSASDTLAMCVADTNAPWQPLQKACGVIAAPVLPILSAWASLRCDKRKAKEFGIANIGPLH